MTTIRTKPPLSLDDRVAAAMADPDSPPSIFADLIAEVGVAAKHSDQEKREARALSVDPTVVDPAARSRAVDAELIAERIHNALTALQERQNAAVTREQVAAWHADADRVQADRDLASGPFVSTHAPRGDVQIAYYRQLHVSIHALAREATPWLPAVSPEPACFDPRPCAGDDSPLGTSWHPEVRETCHSRRLPTPRRRRSDPNGTSPTRSQRSIAE